MKKLNISKQTDFIGCWNLENDMLCENIIKFFEERKDLQRAGITGYGKDEKAKKSIDISIDPKNLELEDYKIFKIYMGELFKCYKDYKSQWSFLQNNMKILDIPRFNVQKYEAGGHYALLHSERTTSQSMYRVFAWMTYLNNVDDGGDTYFQHYDLKIKPEKGKTIIWPCEWTHAHSGEILNKGLKYIITGWIQFPFFFDN